MDIPTPPHTTAAIDKHSRQNQSPEFIRLPRSGEQCRFTGLSRSALNALILGANPPVRSVSLRKRGSIRGVRLINYASLQAYLHGLGTLNTPDKGEAK